MAKSHGKGRTGTINPPASVSGNNGKKGKSAPVAETLKAAPLPKAAAEEFVIRRPKGQRPPASCAAVQAYQDRADAREAAAQKRAEVEKLTTQDKLLLGKSLTTQEKVDLNLPLSLADKVALGQALSSWQKKVALVAATNKISLKAARTLLLRSRNKR